MKFHGGINTAKYDDFSVNVPRRTLSPLAREYMERGIEGIYRYPSIDCASQKEKLKEELGASVAIGNGATDLIYTTVESFGIKNAIILEPTFTEYRAALELGGAQIHSFNILGFDEDDLARAVAIKALVLRPDAIFICNPNNPLGSFYNPNFFLTLLEGSDALIVIDESFIDFVDNLDLKAHNAAMVELISKYPARIIIIRSMTKAYSVPGIRIGYSICSEYMFEHLSRHLRPWSVNAFAIEFLNFILENDLIFNARVSDYFEHRQAFLSRIAPLPIIKKIHPSTVNFVLIETKIRNLNALLNARGINIRTCSDFMFLTDCHYRINIRREGMETLIQAMEDICL